jgi:hypothetical protein
MKNILISLTQFTKVGTVALMMGLVSISYTSCKTDGCTDATATNYDDKADNDDGSCTFERDALIGSYGVSGTVNCGVTGTGAVTGVTFVIAESTVATNKIIITFNGISLTCTVSGSGFTIDNQTVSGFAYTGNGNVAGNALNVTINEFDASIPETCVFTLNGTRQ